MSKSQTTTQHSQSKISISTPPISNLEEIRRRIDAQANVIIERYGKPHAVYLSRDLFKRFVRASQQFNPYSFAEENTIMFMALCCDIPIKVVDDKEDYVMVEDYLDALAEKELLGE